MEQQVKVVPGAQGDRMPQTKSRLSVQLAEDSVPNEVVNTAVEALGTSDGRGKRRMRVLFVSSFYPPHVIGGWEQLVDELNAHFCTRGHVTHVLTSRHGVSRPTREGNIDRVLHLESDLLAYRPRDVLTYPSRLKENLIWTRRTIAHFEPDVVFVHSIWNLAHGVPWVAETMCPGRVVYYAADYSLATADLHTQFWNDRPRAAWRRTLKRVIAPVALGWIRGRTRHFTLAPRRVLCVSRHIRDTLLERLPIEADRLHIVHNGVDSLLFTPAATKHRKADGGLAVLYAGSLVAHKGVDSAIYALGLLKEQGRLRSTRLTIAGDGPGSYRQHLETLCDKLGVREHVRFLGRIDRRAMPELMRGFDVFVFPSRWEEPLARSMQEAMAAGLAVVGTATGGTGELLIDGDTGLTFAPDSPQQLAEHLYELQRRPDLASELGRRARDAVIAAFDIRRMVEETETHLLAAAAGQ